MRRIGTAAAAVIARFPVERTVRADRNDAKVEFIFAACDGLPPARQKRLICLAASEDVGLLDHQQAALALNALGLRDA